MGVGYGKKFLPIPTPVPAKVTIDASNGKLLADLNAHAEIFRQEFRDSTVVIRCYLPKHLLHYIQDPDVTVRMLEVGETAKPVGEAVL